MISGPGPRAHLVGPQWNPNGTPMACHMRNQPQLPSYRAPLALGKTCTAAQWQKSWELHRKSSKVKCVSPSNKPFQREK